MDTDTARDVLAAVGALFVIARVVVKLTPSKKDDEVVGKLDGLLKLFLGR